MDFKKLKIMLILGVIHLPLDAVSDPLAEITYSVRYPNQVTQLLNQVNSSNLWNDLEKLTSFPNRSANTQYGLEAENWIKAQIENSVQQHQRTDVSVYTIETPNRTGVLQYDSLSSKYQPFSVYKQSSVILKIGNSNEPGIIIGAHLDTIANDAEYIQRENSYISVNDFLLLPEDAKPEDFSQACFSIRLQKKEGNVIAYWNKASIGGDQIVNQILLSDDLKKFNLEKITSLFPEKGKQPRRMVRAEDTQLLDGIASLCNFIYQVPGGIFPGADDDGSGAATLLETAKILLASPIQFKRPIYLIWYAAEENNMLGSQEVVMYFKDKNIPVEAIMQLDQTGYVFNNDPTLYLDIDETDVALTQYLQTLATYYLQQPVRLTHGGGSSDHESWFFSGFKRIVRPAEDYSHSPSNPYMHSSEDTMDKLSLNHMVDYLKLTIAFTTELAEPVS